MSQPTRRQLIKEAILPESHELRMRMGLAMSLVAASIALALVAVLAPATPPGWLFVLCLLLSAFLIA